MPRGIPHPKNILDYFKKADHFYNLFFFSEIIRPQSLSELVTNLTTSSPLAKKKNNFLLDYTINCFLEVYKFNI